MNDKTLKQFAALLKSGCSVNFIGDNAVNTGIVENQFNIAPGVGASELMAGLGNNKDVEEYIKRFDGNEQFAVHFAYFRQFFVSDGEAQHAVYQLSRFSSFEHILRYMIVELADNKRITQAAMKSGEMYAALTFFSNFEKDIADSYYHKKVDSIFRTCVKPSTKKDSPGHPDPAGAGAADTADK